MKIKIIRQTFVRGELAKPGDTFDKLPDADINNLLWAGKAVEVTEEPEAEKDEYLELVKGMNDKQFAVIAKELKIEISKLKRDEANKLVAEAMKAAEVK